MPYMRQSIEKQASHCNHVETSAFQCLYIAFNARVHFASYTKFKNHRHRPLWGTVVQSACAGVGMD